MGRTACRIEALKNERAKWRAKWNAKRYRVRLAALVVSVTVPAFSMFRM